MKSTGLALFIVLAVGSLIFCIHRDIHIERNYGHDLRNRVVGARLQMDGKSPYYYHWQVSDGIRYWDDMNKYPLKISNVTASPFFHQLMYPIANLPQRTISLLWLAGNYLLFFATTLLAFLLAKSKKQKWLVAFAALLFLYSRAWTTEIDLGQYYMIIPFLSMLIFYLLTRQPAVWILVLAGICAMSIVLIRFNTVLILFPLILIGYRYSTKFKLAFCAGALAICIFAFAGSQNRLYWKDYIKAIDDHISLHLNLPAQHESNELLAHFTEWEGWNVEQSRALNADFQYKRVGEYGNVSYVVEQVTQWKMPAWLISSSCLFVLATISFLYYRKHKPNVSAQPEMLAMLGYLLYMVTDVWSPIHRYQYNSSQFLFLPLLFAAYYKPSTNKWIVTGIVTGILLNCLPGMFALQRTLGEYLIYLFFFAFLLTKRPLVKK